LLGTKGYVVVVVVSKGCGNSSSEIEAYKKKNNGLEHSPH
jgi:hypothetical protein